MWLSTSDYGRKRPFLLKFGKGAARSNTVHALLLILGFFNIHVSRLMPKLCETLARIERITEIQLWHGRHVLIENARESEAWSHPRMLRVRQRLQQVGEEFDRDLCQHNLRTLSDICGANASNNNALKCLPSVICSRCFSK